MQHDTHHLLDLDLLERPKPTRPRLHVQIPLRSIPLTSGTRTLLQRRKRLLGDLLEDLVPAHVTSVGVDEQEGLDF